MTYNKHKSEKLNIVIVMLVIFAILLAVILGGIIYITRYKVTIIDICQSPDGMYNIELQAIGEPYWPFGAAPGRLVLSADGVTTSQTRIEISNDGCRFTANAWNVVWFDDYVEIVLFGEEQYDELVTLYFDGQVKSERLETHYGKDVWYSEETNTENPIDTTDNEEQELSADQRKIEAGYLAIYELVSNNSFDDFEIYYGASESSTRCVLFEYEDTIEYLVYDRDSQNSECGLYVHYKSCKTADGIWDYSDGAIVNIYAYVYEKDTVVSSEKTQWNAIGSENYQKVTGEN